MNAVSSNGTVHNLPDDLRIVLASNHSAGKTWEDITPLARNEWICWVESAKQLETRQRRIRIAGENLGLGKRRPCCWAGCIHRSDRKPYIVQGKNKKKMAYK